MSDSIVNQITGKLLGLAKGATAAVYATVRTIDVDHNALDVAINGALPLPSGAATEAGHLATIDTSTATTATHATTIAGAVNSGAMVVKGAGTAGTAAAAVLTVQGIASMTPVAVSDNSSSLTVDAPVGTPVFVRLSDGAAAVSPALAATQTDGTQIAIAKGAAATGAAVSGNPVYVGGIDGGGLARPLLTNASGALQVGFHQGTAYSSSAAELSAVISASPTRISQVRIQNLGGSTRYAQLFNATSLPGNGAVPVALVGMATNSSAAITFAIPTDRFSTGCTIGCSSSQGTLTIVATNDFLIAADKFPVSA